MTQLTPAGVRWTQVVDESGASMANWTSLAGTWSADAGGFLKQTDTTAAYRGLQYNSDVYPGAGLVVEAEVRFPTAATTGRRAMLAPASSGSVSAVHDPWAGLGENTSVVWVQRGDQSAASLARTVAEDTWYRVRLTLAGTLLTVEVDGAYQISRRIVGGANEAMSNKLVLVNYTGEAHYRNIKAWRLAGPP